VTIIYQEVEIGWGQFTKKINKPVDVKADGPGPDADNRSPYSWHWYNPCLPKDLAGKGPEAARTIAITFVKSDRSNVQAGDWAAHFLADMSTPVHVFGIDRSGMANILKAYAEAVKTDTPLTLPPEVVGPEGGKNKFWKYAVSNYIAAAAKSTCVEYFDPWYYDQWPNSTHATWETTNHIVNATVAPGAYNPNWKNPAIPSFDNYLEDYGSNVSALAALAATNTRSNYTTLSNCNVQDQMRAAIENVATLWRASFSALRPQLKMTADPSTANVFMVTGLVANAAAAQAAGAVAARLSVQNGEILEGAATNVLGDVAPKGAAKPAVWKIKAKEPAQCRLKLEVIGAYKDVPDLQYAMLEQGLPAGKFWIFCRGCKANFHDEYPNEKTVPKTCPKCGKGVELGKAGPHVDTEQPWWEYCQFRPGEFRKECTGNQKPTGDIKTTGIEIAGKDPLPPASQPPAALPPTMGTIPPPPAPPTLAYIDAQAGPPPIDPEPAPPPPPAKPTFELQGKRVKSGAEIVVKLGSLPAPDKRPLNAWIGFYKQDADNRDYLSYTFLKNLNRDTYDVAAPEEAGKYNFRLFYDESYQAVGVSDPVEVAP
jgi:hypothetical protein